MWMLVQYDALKTVFDYDVSRSVTLKRTGTGPTGRRAGRRVGVTGTNDLVEYVLVKDYRIRLGLGLVPVIATLIVIAPANHPIRCIPVVPVHFSVTSVG